MQMITSKASGTYFVRYLFIYTISWTIWSLEPFSQTRQVQHTVRILFCCSVVRNSVSSARVLLSQMRSGFSELLFNSFSICISHTAAYCTMLQLFTAYANDYTPCFKKQHFVIIFTARCRARSCDCMSSVHLLSICDIGGSWPHRLKILETNCATN